MLSIISVVVLLMKVHLKNSVCGLVWLEDTVQEIFNPLNTVSQSKSFWVSLKMLCLLIVYISKDFLKENVAGTFPLFGLWQNLCWLYCESITHPVAGPQGCTKPPGSISEEEEARTTEAQPCSTHPWGPSARQTGLGFPWSVAPGLCSKVISHSDDSPCMPSPPLSSFVSFNYNPIESLKG